ncbi:hypothetical protein DW047_23540 [Phocaeicola vulgatus]|nr:hypothetical protein DW047_23540 [Phocaeicola vulgatus]
MHAILNTFKSGVGDCVFMRLIKDDATFSIMIDCGKYTPDCVFMRLIKDDATFSIMIDCGKYTPEINLFIKEKLHKHIDLLVL